MPRAFDRQRLPIDRNPLDNLQVEVSRLPKFRPLDKGEIFTNAIGQLEELTGLNLTSPEAFLQSVVVELGQAIAEFNQFLQVDVWRDWIDNVWSSLTGMQPDTTISPADATDQFALLMATTAAQATTIAQLQAAVNKPPGGIVGGDDFERADATTLGGGWKVYSDNSNGRFEVQNGQAVWIRSGGLPNLIRVIRIDPKDAKTATPYQAVTRVTGTTVLQPVFLSESAEDIVLARVSDDHKAYMMAWWDVAGDGKGRLHLAYDLGAGAGIKEVQVVPCDKPAPGVPLTLECGDANPDPAKAPYSYRVIRGNSALIEWDDPNRLTTPLITNRGWGFGGRSVGSLFGQYAPSSAHSVTVADLRSP